MSDTALTGGVAHGTTARVLIIEDETQDPAATAAVQIALEAERYDVEVADGAADGLRRFALNPPSVVLLRAGQVDKRWVELCRHMHSLGDVPIIIGFRLESWADAIPAFELGVVGYISRPDRLQELVARVRAALRIAAIAPHPVSMDGRDDPEGPRGRFVSGVLDADLAGRKVKVAGQPVHLTRLEFDLLELLLSPPVRFAPARRSSTVSGAVRGSRAREPSIPTCGASASRSKRTRLPRTES